MIAGLLVAPAAGTTETNSQTVHVLVTVEDQDTEIELWIDGNWKGQHILDQGRTVYAYKTKAKKPTVKLLAYGDEIRPELTQGRNGDWYGVVDIKRPRDGDTVPRGE